MVPNTNNEPIDYSQFTIERSAEDQAEYQKLYKSEVAIVSEINKRHILSEL